MKQLLELQIDMDALKKNNFFFNSPTRALGSQFKERESQSEPKEKLKPRGGRHVLY